MKRVALFSVLFALVISLAAPTGAVFALEEGVDSTLPAEEEAQSASAEPEVDTQPEIVETVEILESGLSGLGTKEVVAPLQLPPLEVPEPHKESELPVITTPAVAPVVSEPVTTPPLAIATSDVSDGVEFIELYNQSDAPIDIGAVRLQGSAGGEKCQTTIADTGYIMPDEFFYVRSPTYLPGHFDRQFGGECMLTQTITRLELFVSESRVQLIDGIQLNAGMWGAHTGAWSKDGARKNVSSLKQSGSFADHYMLVATNASSLYSSGAYVPPASVGGLKIVELLPNSRSCAPEDMGFDCDDYIKVVNDSENDINIAPFRLRAGSRTANATATTSFNWHEPTLHPARDELILPAGEYFTLKKRNDGAALSLSNAESHVWLEDYFGVTTYRSVSYKDMDLAVARDKSWAYDDLDNVWQFGVPSPYGANKMYVPVEEEPGRGSVGGGLKPCGLGQYRSEETNRCRNIAVASRLTPCREGQYRSEETNRCRSIATAAASVLKPCAEGQFRNPETNRCKKIASAEDIALADCGEGRERNPETNRCRNVAVAGSLTDTMPFPVEQVGARAENFVGWWTLGVIAVVGAGYGAFEWREELRDVGRRVGRFVTRSK